MFYSNYYLADIFDCDNRVALNVWSAHETRAAQGRIGTATISVRHLRISSSLMLLNAVAHYAPHMGELSISD